MDQPVPNVSEEDVKRVVLRDFGEEQQQLVFSTLDEFGRRNSRVRVAILKLASGDIDVLRQATKIAMEDWRDVLAPAEYPRWTREIGFARVSESLRRKVIDDDWKQYCDWLEREPKKETRFESSALEWLNTSESSQEVLRERRSVTARSASKRRSC